MNDTTLGERELDVMQALWAHGPGTVAEVRDVLPVNLAYTTVLTILRNLEEKGFVAHTAEGRAHRYHPTVTQDAARSSAVSRVVSRLFEGSAEELLVHLVKKRKLSAEDLARLSRTLDEEEDT